MEVGIPNFLEEPLMPRRWPMLVLLLLVSGCASTDVTSRQTYEGAALPRPNRIIVQQFGVTPGEVPSGSVLAQQAAGTTPQTAEDVQAGRQLSAALTTQLVSDLRGAGLPAVQAEGQTPAQPGDIVVTGNFFSVDEGSAGKRVLLGFGAGAADLRTEVEVFQMTPQGLRRLAGGTLDSEGNKMPGLAAPLALYAVTSSPVGLIVVGTSKLYGAATGSNTIEAAGKRTADAIAAEIEAAARKQGWI